jgi:hypothetical protein
VCLITALIATPLGLQTFKERAINALVSPLVLRLGLKLTTALEHRLAQDFNLPFVGPEAASHSARLILINSAVGLGPTRSLPPRVKASRVPRQRGLRAPRVSRSFWQLACGSVTVSRL